MGASAEGFGSSFGVTHGQCKEGREEEARGRVLGREDVPRSRVVLSGDLEKGEYLSAFLSGKETRQGWLGEVLLLKMVVAFEYDRLSLNELLCEPDNEYMRGPLSCLVCWLWAWDGV